MDSNPRWHVVPVALFLDALFLLVSISLALHVPSTRSLAGLPESAALDYDSVPAGYFEPLSSDFIARMLGIPLASSAGPTKERTPSTGLAALGIASPPNEEGGGRLQRTIVEHPFDNDPFEDAYPVSSIPFTAKTNSAGADREQGEPEDCERVGGTVWYRYRPDKNVGLMANTFGSDHAVALGVFEGTDLSDLKLVDCDVHPAGNAQVVFPSKKDRWYFFQVAAPVAGGDLVFSLDPLGTTRLVSVAVGGKKSGDRGSFRPSVSADGRYVAFDSQATDLVRRRQKKTCFWWSQEKRDCPDVYVRDMVTGRNELVSKNSRGRSANAPSFGAAISGNGRYVAFFSKATNLVPDDNNDATDFFVHDRRTHRTERVSVASDGQEGTIPWAGNRPCKDDIPATIPELDTGLQENCDNPPSLALRGLGISSDGRYVVFATPLHGLVKPEPPHCTDLTGHDQDAGLNHGPGVPIMADAGAHSCRHIYLHDRKTNQTRLVSVSSDGDPAEGDSGGPFISRNGRWVVYSSSADNLVDNDTNDYRDVFVHDLRTGATELISVDTWGRQGDAQSGGTNIRGHQTISDNGRWVAFVSHASNLTADDGNQLEDVFLRDRRSGQTLLVSGSSGSDGPTTDLIGAGHSSISTNGRYIAFVSAAGDVSQSKQELFVWDRITQTITRVSVATSGETCEGKFSHEPELSADGHFVVFESDCTNLDRRHSEGNATKDVFIHEMPWTR